jgi:hypothetical protein
MHEQIVDAALAAGEQLRCVEYDSLASPLGNVAFAEPAVFTSSTRARKRWSSWRCEHCNRRGVFPDCVEAVIAIADDEAACK